MKNKLLILTLLLSTGAFAQNRLYNLTTQFDSVKVRKLLMTSIQTGSATDSVLVKKANGGVFKVSRSSFGTGNGSVTSFGKVDGIGISSSVSNPTTTPVHTIAVDTTTIATKANSYTLAQLQTKTSNFIKQGGNTFGQSAVIGTADLNDVKIIRNSFESLVVGNNATFNIPVSAPGLSGISTTGTAGYFNNSSTGSGATLVVNNQSTGLLATFGKSGSTKVTIYNDGSVSTTGTFTGYGLTLPQRGVGADYTLTDVDYAVLVTGSSSTINIYLPVAAVGRIYIIKRTLGGTGAVIISSPGSVIDGVSTKTLTTDNSGIVVQSAGAGQYYIIGTI